MILWRRALPKWFPVAVLGLVLVPPLVDVFFKLRTPILLPIVSFMLLWAFATDWIVATGLRRLVPQVAPSPVFVIEYDGGSRGQLEALAGARISDPGSFLVVQLAGAELWTLDTEPKLEGLIPWHAFAEATVTATRGRWSYGTIEVLWPDGRAAYFDARVRLIERIRHRGANAVELASALIERVTPAHPDAAHTPPRAQSD